MKVCQQRIDDAEVVRWVDENIGSILLGSDVAVFIRGRLKHAHTGRANGNDAPSRPLGFVDRLRCFGRNLEPLLVHRVILDRVALHRLKRPRANVQRDFRHADAHGFQIIEERSGEMQPGRGGGHGAFLLCVHRLVALPVCHRVGRVSLNVRWQRRLSNLRQQLKDVRRIRQLEEVLAGFVFVDGRHPVVGGRALEVV